MPRKLQELLCFHLAFPDRPNWIKHNVAGSANREHSQRRGCAARHETSAPASATCGPLAFVGSA
ncbi:MAG TPA: hypothetical protein VMH81_23090, partial [Bryobacteraceae bacterium]|nr:hypothetical protein [Bryobacteraceae bacterium]